MGYIINRYNGAILTTVEDGTVNLTTEIKLIGKNFAGYGEAQNENFLHLMENFANPTPPGKPLSGMIWYDSTVNKIKFYDGSRFRTTGSAEVSPSQPVGNVEGDLWWNSSTNQLYTRSSAGEWVLVGPQTTALGTTQFVSDIVNGIGAGGDPGEFGIIKAVLTNTAGDESTTLIIADSDFTIADPINNFSNVIKRGITLADTNTNGVSEDVIIWGTASNAQQLGGRPISDFVIKPTAGSEFIFDNPITVDGVLRISDDNSIAVVENINGNSILFKINNNGQQTILTINSTGLIPGLNNTYDIGTANLKWKDIHATNFKGTADNANRLNVEDKSEYRVASEGIASLSPGRIVARTAETIGDVPANSIIAVKFVGIATTAQYADLAEKYTTEKTWPIGTAMTVCHHEDHEAGPATAGNISIGVISENPAYLMNSEINGQAIALKGRVPVRVVGPVRKGQAVYAWEDGVCSTVKTTALVGIALVTDETDDETLVECVLAV